MGRRPSIVDVVEFGIFVFRVCMKATLPPGSVTENYALFLVVGNLPWLLLFQETIARVIGIVAGSLESDYQDRVPVGDHPRPRSSFRRDPSSDCDRAGGGGYWDLGRRHERNDVVSPHIHSVDGNDRHWFRMDGGKPERVPSRYRPSSAGWLNVVVLDHTDFHYGRSGP